MKIFYTYILGKEVPVRPTFWK